MAVSTMYGILQISFTRYTMCGPRVCSYYFTKCVVFPTAVKRVRHFVAVKCLPLVSLFIDKTRVLDLISETPLNMDTPADNTDTLACPFGQLCVEVEKLAKQQPNFCQQR